MTVHPRPVMCAAMIIKFAKAMKAAVNFHPIAKLRIPRLLCAVRPIVTSSSAKMIFEKQSWMKMAQVNTINLSSSDMTQVSGRQPPQRAARKAQHPAMSDPRVDIANFRAYIIMTLGLELGLGRWEVAVRGQVGAGWACHGRGARPLRADARGRNEARLLGFLLGCPLLAHKDTDRRVLGVSVAVLVRVVVTCHLHSLAHDHEFSSGQVST